jgi:hypothetical protein
MPAKTVARTRVKKVVSAPPAKRAAAAPKGKPVVRDNPKAPAARRGRPAASQPDVEVKTPLLDGAAQVDMRKRVGGLNLKQVSELSGYSIGSEGYLVAVELLRGGESRIETTHRIAQLLPSETRNSTPKNVSNLVSSVIKRLESQGFKVSGTWKMVKPSGS